MPLRSSLSKRVLESEVQNRLLAFQSLRVRKGLSDNPMRTWTHFSSWASLTSSIGLALCAPCAAETLQYRTRVVPKENETLLADCIYQMIVPHAERPIRNVFVNFERGWQVGNLYFDPDVVRFAARHDMALLLAVHCRCKEREDMDVVPEHGIGRALVTALNQFASQANHPELASCTLVLFSFSGGWSLVARMVNYIPERIAGVVAYAPGQYDPLGMDTIQLSERALAVPELIIANGADDHNGTARPYAFYADYRQRGAPFTFVIQNRTPHCCVMNIVPLALDWLSDVIRFRQPTEDGHGLQRMDENAAWLGFLDVEDSRIKEHLWRAKVWNVSSAHISAREQFTPTPGPIEIHIPRAPDDQEVPASGPLVPCWLPSRQFAESWLAFERQAKHPTTQLE